MNTKLVRILSREDYDQHIVHGDLNGKTFPNSKDTFHMMVPSNFSWNGWDGSFPSDILQDNSANYNGGYFFSPLTNKGNVILDASEFPRTRKLILSFRPIIIFKDNSKSTQVYY